MSTNARLVSLTLSPMITDQTPQTQPVNDASNTATHSHAPFFPTPIVAATPWAVGSPSSSTHSLTALSGPTLTGPTQRRPAPLDTSKFTTESPRPTPRDLYSLFPPHDQPDEQSVLTIRPLWKRRLHELLEQPASSRSAFAVHMVSMALIVTSALITVLTVPTFHRVSNRVWFGMETGLVVVFTVEYIARVVCWSFTWSSLFRWVLSFYGIIDLLFVLPYYIELILGQDTSVLFRFSILRMFRLLRVFRPFRYIHTILLCVPTLVYLVYLSVRRSQHALLAIGFFVVMILMVFSTLLYFAERGTWDEVMDTFINSDGCGLVRDPITTVGYGEITPRSFLGRLITLPILVFGLLLITLPSFDNHTSPNSTDDLPGTTYPPAPQPLGASSSSRRPHTSMHPSSSSTSQPQHIRASSYDPFLATPAPAPSTAVARDLSNLKLGQNQTELSRQIAELAEEVGRQGVLLGRLVEVLGEGVLRGEGGDGLKRRGKRREARYEDEDGGRMIVISGKVLIGELGLRDELSTSRPAALGSVRKTGLLFIILYSLF
ncbi:hypothetical protein DFP72DRAFT_1078399 [Ephemerocybe angulata]|uniref:Ion transport domain-containing protein n=1 Tax=Ephemerocybe angulata TaxID=980116 RepID=A0A8H6HE99_9AGAR|nr:hypothetical protein DFP72DRAFT_1078399 [Tulosesus angulatus]